MLTSSSKKNVTKTYRVFLAILFCVVSFSMTPHCVNAGEKTLAKQTQPPNIVFFFADDLGYSELGCYGQKKIKTPHIDKLAEEGMRFTQFYSGNAVCAPCRSVLLTGKHAGHASIRNNKNPSHLEYLREKNGWEFPGQYPIPDEDVTIAEVLKQKGYATAAIGKWGLGHFGTTGDPNKQGFDLFYGFNCQVHAHNHYPKFLWRNNKKEILPGNDRTLHGKTYSQDRFRDVALEFIDKNKEKPFFLYLPFAIPHVSIQVPEKSLEQYKGKFGETGYKSKYHYESHPTSHTAYAAMITHMDRDIGTIMQKLKDLNLDKNTIVIFSSDNGPTHGRVGGADSSFFRSAYYKPEQPFRGLKGSLYEGGIRVPLIARWPGRIAPGTVSDRVSALWDLMPTFAEATETKPPEKIDGISLLPTLLGDKSKPKEHEFLYWEFPAYGGQQAVRMGDWKGIRQNMQIRRLNKTPLKIELYNLATDVGESKDVSAENPEVVKKIRAIMKEQHTPSDVFKLIPVDKIEAKKKPRKPTRKKQPA